jgi:NADH:ubiquinone oxidoreductase subunit 4 (subunit M)
VLLILYILIPAVAAPLAWLLGRSNPLVARWTAVLGTAVPLVILVVQWAAKASALQAGFVARGAGPAGMAAGSWIADV